MRIDSTLDVTPEGSLSDLPAAVRGVEDSRRKPRTQEASEIETGGTHPFTTIVTLIEETPYTSVKTVPGRDSSEQRTSQVEPPRKIPRTRDPSREDALASTRCFFSTVNGQDQVVMSKLPEEVQTATAEGATAITSTVLTTSSTTTITGTEAESPRTFLPSRSPSRPTATATCRPQMWVKCVSEGWTNGPPPHGTGSTESGLSEPSLLEEGVPEN